MRRYFKEIFDQRFGTDINTIENAFEQLTITKKVLPVVEKYEDGYQAHLVSGVEKFPTVVYRHKLFHIKSFTTKEMAIEEIIIEAINNSFL